MIVAAFVVSIVALIASAIAALYTWKQYQTAERARRTDDDPLFRAQWIRYRRYRDTIVLATGEYEYEDDDEPTLRLTNNGSATAFDCYFGVKGKMIGPKDLPPRWTAAWRAEELNGRSTFTFRWTNRDNTRGEQKLKIVAPPANTPLYDSRFGNPI